MGRLDEWIKNLQEEQIAKLDIQKVTEPSKAVDLDAFDKVLDNVMEESARGYAKPAHWDELNVVGKAVDEASRWLERAQYGTPVGRGLMKFVQAGAKTIMGDPEYGKERDVSTGNKVVDGLLDAVGGAMGLVASIQHFESAGDARAGGLLAGPIGRSVSQAAGRLGLGSVDPRVISGIRGAALGLTTTARKDILNEDYTPSWKEYLGRAAFMGVAGPVSETVMPHIQYAAPGIHPLAETALSSAAGGAAGGLASLPFEWSELSGEGLEKVGSALKKVGLDSATYALFGTLMMALQPETWGDRSSQMQTAARNADEAFKRYNHALSVKDIEQAKVYEAEFKQWANTFYHYARQQVNMHSSGDAQWKEAVESFWDINPQRITPEQYREAINLLLVKSYNLYGGGPVGDANTGTAAGTSTDIAPTQPSSGAVPIGDMQTGTTPVSGVVQPTLAGAAQEFVESLQSFQEAKSPEEQISAMERFLRAGSEFENQTDEFANINDHPERDQLIAYLETLGMTPGDFGKVINEYKQAKAKLKKPSDLITKKDIQKEAGATDIVTHDDFEELAKQQTTGKTGEDIRRSVAMGLEKVDPATVKPGDVVYDPMGREFTVIEKMKNSFRVKDADGKETALANTAMYKRAEEPPSAETMSEEEYSSAIEEFVRLSKERGLDPQQRLNLWRETTGLTNPTEGTKDDFRKAIDGLNALPIAVEPGPPADQTGAVEEVPSEIETKPVEPVTTPPTETSDENIEVFGHALIDGNFDLASDVIWRGLIPKDTAQTMLTNALAKELISERDYQSLKRLLEIQDLQKPEEPDEGGAPAVVPPTKPDEGGGGEEVVETLEESLPEVDTSDDSLAPEAISAEEEPEPIVELTEEEESKEVEEVITEPTVKYVKPDDIDSVNIDDTIAVPHGEGWKTGTVLRINKQSFRIKDDNGKEVTVPKSKTHVPASREEDKIEKLRKALEKGEVAALNKAFDEDKIPYTTISKIAREAITKSPKARAASEELGEALIKLRKESQKGKPLKERFLNNELNIWEEYEDGTMTLEEIKAFAKSIAKDPKITLYQKQRFAEEVEKLEIKINPVSTQEWLKRLEELPRSATTYEINLLRRHLGHSLVPEARDSVAGMLGAQYSGWSKSGELEQKWEPLLAELRKKGDLPPKPEEPAIVEEDVAEREAEKNVLPEKKVGKDELKIELGGEETVVTETQMERHKLMVYASNIGSKAQRANAIKTLGGTTSVKTDAGIIRGTSRSVMEQKAMNPNTYARAEQKPGIKMKEYRIHYHDKPSESLKVKKAEYDYFNYVKEHKGALPFGAKTKFEHESETLTELYKHYEYALASNFKDHILKAARQLGWHFKPTSLSDRAVEIGKAYQKHVEGYTTKEEFDEEVRIIFGGEDKNYHVSSEAERLYEKVATSKNQGRALLSFAQEFIPDREIRVGMAQDLYHAYDQYIRSEGREEDQWLRTLKRIKEYAADLPEPKYTAEDFKPSADSYDLWESGNKKDQIRLDKKRFFVNGHQFIGEKSKLIWLEVKGAKVAIPGLEDLDFFIHRPAENPTGGWVITEGTTGLSIVTGGSTRKKAIDEAIKIVKEEQSPEKVREAIKKQRERFPLSPRHYKYEGGESYKGDKIIIEELEKPTSKKPAKPEEPEDSMDLQRFAAKEEKVNRFARENEVDLATAVQEGQSEELAAIFDGLDDMEDLPDEYNHTEFIKEQTKLLLGPDPESSAFYKRSVDDIRAQIDNYNRGARAILEHEDRIKTDITKEELWEAARRKVRMNLQLFAGEDESETLKEWKEFFTGLTGRSGEGSGTADSTELVERQTPQVPKTAGEGAGEIAVSDYDDISDLTGVDFYDSEEEQRTLASLEVPSASKKPPAKPHIKEQPFTEFVEQSHGQWRIFNTKKTIEAGEIERETTFTTVDRAGRVRQGNKAATITEINSSIQKHHGTAKHVVEQMAAMDTRVKAPRMSGVKKFLTLDRRSPELIAQMVEGTSEGPLRKILYEDIDEGVTKRYELYQRGKDTVRRILREVNVTNEQLDKWSRMFSKNKKKVEVFTIKLSDGKALRVTAGERMTFYANSRADYNRDTLLTGGFRFGHNLSVVHKITEEDLDTIIASMSDAEKEVVDRIAQEWLNSVQKEAINETSEFVDGYPRARVVWYWPVQRSKIDYDVDKELNMLNFDHRSLVLMGILRPRTDAEMPVVINDYFSVLDQNMQNAAAYHGLALPIRNARHVLRDQTFMEQMYKSGQEEAHQVLENYIDDVEGAVIRRETADKMALGLLQKIQVSFIALNPFVMAKQPISYLLAATEMDAKYLTKAALTSSKQGMKEAKKYSPQLRYRSEGYIDRELGEIAEVAGVMRTFTDRELLGQKMTKGITFCDEQAVGRIWNAVKFETKELHPKLKGDDFWEHVARRTEHIVNRNQPTFTDHTRSAIGRTKSRALKGLTIFSTQRNKNSNIVDRAWWEYQNSGKANADKAKLFKALFLTLVASPLVVLGVDKARDKLLGKEEDTSYFDAGLQVLSTNLGNYYLLGNFFDMIVSRKKYGTLFGFNLEDPVNSTIGMGADGITHLLDAIDHAFSGEMYKSGLKKDEKKWETDVMRAISDLSNFAARTQGFPLESLRRYLGGAMHHLSPGTKFKMDKLTKNPISTTYYEKMWTYLAKGDTEKAKQMADILKDEFGVKASGVSQSGKTRGVTEAEIKQALRWF